MGYLGATLTQLFTRGRSGRITQRCHNTLRWETGLASANDVTHRKRAEDFGRFWKSQWVELRPTSGEEGWLLLPRRTQASGHCGGCHMCWGADEKARIERMCISLSYVETFNSKVIKCFVPELRSRNVFFEFRDSYVLSLWTFDVRFTHSHIWLWNTANWADWREVLIDESTFR